MNRLTTYLCAILVLAGLLINPFAKLNAQTNFVKYMSGKPVLPLGAEGTWDDTEAGYAHILVNDTTYHMWYSGAPQPESYRIGYATSSEGFDWHKEITNPVLGPGAPGDFDDAGAWQPMVLFDGADYEMWYSGNFYVGAIGFATSTDGLSWIRNSENPVLEKSPGAWDHNLVANPFVIRRDTLYQMWYAGQSVDDIWQTGYATSTDGINWSKHPDNPVLRAGAPGEWDSGGAVAGSIIYEDGLYHMWYFNWTRSVSGLKIGYATSPDGINWSKHPDNPVLKPDTGDWDVVNTYFPRVIKEGNRYRMWYTGRRSGSIDRLCYAEDFSNAAHVDSVWVRPETLISGFNEILIEGQIVNPHGENLIVRAIIESEDGGITEYVDMYTNNYGLWQGKWMIPDGEHVYSVGVELQNISSGYVYNSIDWAVSDKFKVKQTTHSFTQTAHAEHGGYASGVAVGPDGTVFLANTGDGLRAYNYDGNSFTNTAHVFDGGSAVGIVIASDGTVFLANDDDGLRAYSYDGSSFSNIAHINDGGESRGVAIASDGTVFLANGDDGLRAYSYDGSYFTNTAHVKVEVDSTYDHSFAQNVVISSEGTIFLANGRDGLRAYTYDGSSFNNTAHVKNASGVFDVTVASDGTIFIANGSEGLRAYSYDGSSFTETAHINDPVAHGGTSSLSRGVALAPPDGTVFLAVASYFGGGAWGLWAYNYDGNSFTNTAYINDDGAENDIAVGDDGTIFLASGAGGLYAYTYNEVSRIEQKLSNVPANYILEQNYPNPFNPSTTIRYSIQNASNVEIAMFNLAGQKVTTLINKFHSPGSYQVNWDGSNFATGVYIYQIKADGFVQAKKMLLIK